MNIQYTKWQTQRRCVPDKTELNVRLVVKGCSRLDLTYQIFFLAEEAEREQALFVLRVLKGCKISSNLRQFIKEHKYTRLERC